MDEVERQQFQEMVNAEEMRVGFAQFSQVLKAGVQQLMDEGWSEEHAREIVVAFLRSAGR